MTGEYAWAARGNLGNQLSGTHGIPYSLKFFFIPHTYVPRASDKKSPLRVGNPVPESETPKLTTLTRQSPSKTNAETAS